ncbi:DUF2750 domain-containing protein [Bacillus sp. EAC]|uniref:DUF2750 domain-containing protein n=1 Tax=Bacillus sp. EAC TaxID=1978338 RepID=UPI000B44483F|nr:DUF2750 domain-containing protein [Bacillus sp. EAC]
MNKKENEAIINQEPHIRYEYFVKKVCECEEVWILFKDSSAAIVDADGNTRFPFFPEKESAETFAVGSEFRAESIDMDNFINGWLKQMKIDGIKPSIFPNGKNMTIVEVDVLLRDLKKELESN